jgi:hypothetical protein
MYVSEQEAAAMYARACQAWYGERANQVVATRIKQLRRKGDLGGVRAWTQVSAELSKLQINQTERTANA